jgi:hypothetical protein
MRRECQHYEGENVKLEISKEEMEAVLLEWAEKQWPGCFNTVEIDSSYSTIRKAEFSKETPEPEKPVALAAV